jgi:phage recombination protein Bet
MSGSGLAGRGRAGLGKVGQDKSKNSVAFPEPLPRKGHASNDKPTNKHMTNPENHQEKQSALVVMARQLSVEPQKLLQTLKDTVFKGASDSELLTLVVVSNTYGLNPLLKEIYAFPAKGGGIVPVVSIDGWISMVNRQPQLDGLEFEFDSDANGKPISCTCVIYIKDRSHPVRVTEFYEECFRATEPWKQMPRRMLRHKALKEAGRVAFGFSGVTDEDEARDIKMANAREFPPPRKIVDKPDFTPPAPPAPGGQGTATEPPPPSQPKEKAKVSKKVAEAPQTRLFSMLSQAQINQTDFIEGLKLIKFPEVPADAEIVHELSDEVCEAIFSVGLSQIFIDIQAAKNEAKNEAQDWEDLKQ